MKKVKYYLIELTIVTIGVLIALLINNIKESYQARQYHQASLENTKNEVKENLSDLARVLEKQNNVLDSLKKYRDVKITMNDLIRKSGGLKVATFRNVSLELYSRNQINSIDYEVMSDLVSMKLLSEFTSTKLSKLLDFFYQNIFADSRESKMLAIDYLENLIESETQLMRLYQDYIDKLKKNERD